MSKASIPKGTRDFSPQEMVKRNYIFSTIRHVFEKFGFMPIETPAMENLSTLTGKYGEEGDQLIFKILNNGDFIAKSDSESYQEGQYKKFAFSISKKALRYDLTVPFARFVVMNQGKISFPFRRYQIQPVWRGDRPGKGRYQEFYQCDVDVVGTNSLLCEVELIQIFDEVLGTLGIQNFTIKINNRKLLAGLAQVLNIEDQLTNMTIAIDKLDKIGVDKVKIELENRGIDQDAIQVLGNLLSADNKVDVLKDILKDNEMGQKGLEELDYIFDKIEILGLKTAKLEFDPTLARGLNYYTGAIFEVLADDVQIGSICGGGRYDDLTGIFGLKNISGVGISFGAARIYDVMEELNLFPDKVLQGTRVLLANFGEVESMESMKILGFLRSHGVASEIYPSRSKMQKQMKYADEKNIPFVGIIGSDELDKGIMILRNMESGEREEVPLAEPIKILDLIK